MELGDYQQAIEVLKKEAERLEMEFIEKALAATTPPGNIHQAAKQWGIARVRIYRKLRKMKKRPNNFRI